MNFLILKALICIAFLSFTSAQLQICHGRTWFPSCDPASSSGFGGLRCPPAVTVWTYDRRSRQCRPLVYMGCGGNNNRWCNRFICEQRCRR